MTIHIPAPQPSDLLSVETVKQYFATQTASFDTTESYGIDDALDHASNGFAMSAGVRRASLSNTPPDGYIAFYLPIIAPDKLTYQGLSDVKDTYEQWKSLRKMMQLMNEGNPSALPPTKLSAQRILNDVYACLDSAPDNKQASYYRDLLQQSAQILGLSPLGHDPARRINPAGSTRGPNP